MENPALKRKLEEYRVSTPISELSLSSIKSPPKKSGQIDKVKSKQRISNSWQWTDSDIEMKRNMRYQKKRETDCFLKQFTSSLPAANSFSENKSFDLFSEESRLLHLKFLYLM